ncbi:hypothetical protein TNCV_1896121 [Trichonephila clavipes]|nr:hypothetical protein TNCV_1896121 [Trichonephila clavipes]
MPLRNTAGYSAAIQEESSTQKNEVRCPILGLKTADTTSWRILADTFYIFTVPSQHRGTLNSLRSASPVVKEERWKALTTPGVLPQNWTDHLIVTFAHAPQRPMATYTGWTQ